MPQNQADPPALQNDCASSGSRHRKCLRCVSEKANEAACTAIKCTCRRKRWCRTPLVKSNWPTRPRMRSAKLDLVKADKRTSLTAPEGKLVCDAYGIPVPKEGVAKSAAEASKIATGMGFPVVMKIVSPDILHKTEAGGVMVGVKTSADVHDANRLGYRRAYCRVVMLRSAPRRPANK